MSEQTEDYTRTQYGWSDGYTECDLHYARKLSKALNEYYDAGHLVEINAAVLIDRIGGAVFGKEVWPKMARHLAGEGK